MDRHEPPVVTPDDEPHLRTILRQAADGVPRADWFEETSVPRHRIDALINWLVAEGYLTAQNPVEGIYALTEEGRAHLS
jgi:hypothetical protein